jgi:hypothetical protein
LKRTGAMSYNVEIGNIGRLTVAISVQRIGGFRGNGRWQRRGQGFEPPMLHTRKPLRCSRLT